MARVIWKGHISFGLVQIPVGLYPATSDVDLDLHMVDRRDMAPIGYKRVNKRTGEEVPSEAIAKAAEAAEGAWVMLDEDEIKAAAPESARSIDIVAFIDADQLDPRYFVRPYYVAPEKRTAKAYALLRETLRSSGKIGVAKVVLRTRQYLSALIVRDDILVLELLRYADEVRGTQEFDLPQRDLEALGVGNKERQMAGLLVTALEDTWDPSRYHDEFREQLTRIVEEKARTGQVTVQPSGAAPPTEAVDIMALLKRSLEALDKGEPGRSPPAEPPPPKGARRRKKEGV